MVLTAETRELEKYIEDIWQSLPIPVCYVNAVHLIIAAGANFEKFSGYDSEELVGVELETLFTDQQEIKKIEEEILNVGFVSNRVTTFITKEKKEVPVLLSATVRKDEENNIFGYFLSMLDITERKQFEQALKESEKRFSAFMEALPHTAFIKTSDHKFLYINNEMKKRFGIEEWIGRTTFDIFPKEIAEKLVEADNKSLIEGYHIEEHIVPDQSGKECIWETHTFRIERENQEPLIGGFSLDITEKKEAEKKLRENEEFLKSIIESIQDGISILNPDLTINFTNDIMKKWYAENLPLEGKKCYQCYHNIKAPCDPCPTLRCIQSGETEWNIVPGLPGSPIKWIELFSYPIKDPDTGKVTGVAEFVRDITSKKQAEEALRQSENKYRELVENMTEGLITIDEKKIVTFVNSKICQMLEYKPEELIGRNILDFFDSKNQKILKQELTKRPEGTFSRYEITFTTKSGKPIPTLISGAPNFDDQGTFRGSYATVLDFTERKQAEEALRQSEEKYRLITETTSDLISLHTFDLKASYNYVSPSVKRITGYEPEELLGKSAFDYIHPEDRKGLLKILKTYIGYMVKNLMTGEKSEFTETIEYRFKHKSGKWIYLQSVGNTLGKHLLFVSRDITQRVQMEASLRESEERYRSVVENSATGVFVIDGNYTFEFVNQRLCQILGYNESEIIGHKFMEFLAPESVELVQDHYQRRQKGEVVLANYEFEVIRKDGERRQVEIYSNVIKDSDGNPHTIAQILDITERVKAEAERDSLESQLRQAQKMEAIGRLAGGVAHDFNNILTIILGYSQMALMNLQPGQKFYSQFQKINDAARRSANMIGKMLAFSRQQNAEPQRLNLNTHLESTKGLLEKMVREDIRMSFILGNGLHDIYLDPTQFDQVIMNLVVNARDAMPKGGSLIIETANFTCDSEYCLKHHGFQPGNYVLISVSDTGCGMDKETQEHIFEPFFTTKGEGEGTGLGLATVYGIVKQNHGFIHVYSEPGKGATFKIYFPVYEGQDEKHYQLEDIESVMGQETILLAEDDADVRAFTRNALQQLGYQVIDFGEPSEALEYFEKHSDEIDLLITDLVMPGMNGQELHRQIEQIKPSIKVLYTSGYTSNIIAVQGIIKRGINFLQKPFAPAVLGKKIRQILDTN
ncbi:MAG TPA: PAS domain S-box protein [Candidatus Marinimicrobia bacterium]|nr:PAS domain S-box protein [Candidatus Neomarinimicrobiota bacterium]HRS52208.1 PAS domain S-box protein [Candidatus Neomarinimicrobiota bacterium]HRU91999.1 PAS domain S-box protein [Candidatus Neomarinimicrobiota bacterium]